MKFVLLFILLVSQGLVKAESLYKYRVAIKDLSITNNSDEPLNNISGKVVASVLTDLDEVKNCIDLRSMGLALSSYLKHTLVQNETIAFLSKAPLNIDVLKQAVFTKCLTLSDNGICNVDITVEELSIENAYIGYDVFENRKHIKFVSMPMKRIPPNFSASCSSGIEADSWTNSASSLMAKVYLERVGLNLQEIKSTFAIYYKLPDESFNQFFSFGFIRH